MTFFISSKRNPIYSIWDSICSFSQAYSLKASAETGQQWRAIAELRAMADYELADIGLSRSDLTPEGLAILGAKRKAKQDGGVAHPDLPSIASRQEGRQ